MTQLVCFNLLTGTVRAESAPLVTGVLISEIQTGSIESASHEFIEIHNAGDETVDLDGWRLEYKTAVGGSWVNKSVFGGELGPDNYYLIVTSNYTGDTVMSSGLAASGGQVRLIDSLNQVVDTAGWGNADSAENDAPADSPEAGKSLQRCFEDDVMLDTNNNAADFKVYDLTAGEALDCPLPGGPPAVDVTCDGIIISEILPNPSGTDADREFIELHNPTSDYISLAGCGLQTNGSSIIYWFSGDIELIPGQYRAFYSSTTGLNLPNAAGGTVYLLSPDEAELTSANYAADLDDDVAWARFASRWRATHMLTPSTANKLQSTKPCPAGQTRSAETSRCRGSAAASTLKPCKPGQERNPDTNRCRSLAGSSYALKPCAPGQERNPATNRCRKIGSSNYELKPCAPGQERNPETNRCRKVGASEDQLKPCKPGQERNPDTNRCRMIQTISPGSDSDSGNPLGTPATIPVSPLSTGLVATTAGLGLLYGAYEFRHDIRNRFRLIREHFGRRHHSGP